jgi:hypothetical protein
MRSWQKVARAGAVVAVMAALFWLGGVMASPESPLVVFGLDLRGSSLASYAGDPVAIAPLRPEIAEDAKGDGRVASAQPSPAGPVRSTPRPTTPPAPRPSPTLPSIQPTPAPSPNALITGQVLDANAKSGIPNAVVTLSPGAQTTVTDQNGGFTFAVSPATYTLTAAATGYAPASQSVTARAGQTQVVTIKLNPLLGTGSIRGTVTDSASGAPITGAVLVLTPTGLSTTSGPGGKYSFAAVPSASYTMTVSATGYATQVLPLTVRSGQQTTVAVSLTAA